MMYSYCFNNVQLGVSFFLPFLEVIVVMEMSHVGVATVLMQHANLLRLGVGPLPIPVCGVFLTWRY